MRKLLFLFPGLLAWAAQGQMVLHNGTAMIVNNGTEVSIESPLTFILEAGAGLTNDGHIDFGPQAELDEQPGAPIVGIGTESTARSYSAALTSAEPAGLGFTFTTAIAPDSFIVMRGHSPRSNNLSAEGIARWYRVRSGNVQGLGASGILAYDLSELNGIPEASLRMARNNDGGAWWPELTSSTDIGTHTTSSALPDSLGWFTLFDDGVITDIGISARWGSEFVLQPSLASEFVMIHGSQRISQLELFDAKGALMRTERFDSPDQVRLNVSSYSSGVYTVLVNERTVLRFLKP